MSKELGPHHQMVTLARKLVTKYRMGAIADHGGFTNDLMAEIEGYLAMANFDKEGFLEHIRGPLTLDLVNTTDKREAALLGSMVTAIRDRQELLKGQA